MNKTIKNFIANGNNYQCDVDAIALPTIERMLRGTTDSDDAIQALNIPNRPLWLRSVVKSLRWYRQKISPHLGNRCVFEPSCSNYAELAFRKEGLLNGFWLTAKRLCRCRPGTGGIDMP